MTADIFCALDTDNLGDAEAMARRLSGLPVHFKLGLEFFIAEGPRGVDAIRRLAGAETKIFLDLKLHDIPNTVAGAVRAAMKCQADFLTLHASGGREMMRAAVLAATEETQKTGTPAPCLLGVTVLTHMDAVDLSGIGIDASPATQVARLAALAEEAELGGIVCAPQEIAQVRARARTGFRLMVPGIRPAGGAAGDQKRIMTPEAAAALGADYLVIGRPITQADDPARAAAEILASLRPRAA